MLTFYYSPGSCALASHIALEEAGASYDAKRIDFGANQQRSPDYLKINPKGRVPALATSIAPSPWYAMPSKRRPGAGVTRRAGGYWFARGQGCLTTAE